MMSTQHLRAVCQSHHSTYPYMHLSFQGNITLIPGIALDREAIGLPHDENGNAVYTLGVTAVDRGTPAQLNYATVGVPLLTCISYAPVRLCLS